MHKNNAKFVSERFIYYALSPLVRSYDVDVGDRPELEFPGMDSNNPTEVKTRVIRSFIVPWIHSYDETSQQITKNSFRYYLNAQLPKPTDGVEFFQGMFDAIIPDFEGPQPIRLFFVWIWEELYGPEDYHTDDLSEFVVDNDRPHWITSPESEE